MQLYYIVLSRILCMFGCIAGMGCHYKWNAQATIQNKLESSFGYCIVASDTLYNTSLVGSFYQFNDYQLGWKDYLKQSGKLTSLIKIIERCEEDGFTPSDYHLACIKEAEQKNKLTSEEQGNLDLLLTDAFLMLALHHYTGKVHGKGMNQDWECFYNDVNLPQLIWSAVQSDSLEQTLQSLRPVYKEYYMLQNRLIRYSALASHYPDSVLLQKEMIKIKLNMERWRWLPKEKNSAFVLVNIPAFQLFFYETDSVALTMKTIVGKPDNKTPAFNCEMSYIVLRPHWNIPTSIARKELLPKILEDTSFLAKNHLLITKTWHDTDTKYINPVTIFWDSMTISNFPYKLKQASGYWNALGQVKFMFPNQFDVYLHDTPTHSLFQENVRTLSHGCIRVEKAGKLVAAVMKDDSFLDTKNYGMQYKENERKALPKKIPVFINYWTVWPDENSIIVFDDVYNQDDKLEKAFLKKPTITL